MGLLKAGVGALAGVLGDQWRDYIYCDSIPVDTLVVKGKKRNGKDNNVLSDGSIIAVNEGQCMIAVIQGKVVEVCAEPGEFVFDSGTEPSIFYGNLGENIMESFKRIGYRFSFNGDTANDIRVYFVNTKEILGNKYGTPAPVPFRVVDANIGLDTDISVRCNGEYSYRIVDPITFFTNVCGNVTDSYKRDQIDGQLKSEFLTHLQPGFARISEMGIRYSAVPGHTVELADAMRAELTPDWTDRRGIAIVAVGMNSITAAPEDEERIKQMQFTAVMRDPNMRAANQSMAAADALRDAASNSAGAMVGFAGVNMASSAAGAMANTGLYDTSQPYQPQNAYQVAQPAAAAAAAAGWTCPNGHKNPESAKFCQECGSPKPAPAGSWVCPNGHQNSGSAKFCQECGAPRPAETWTCSKGHENPNSAKFCQECGEPRT